ncbi:hypothetical protein B0H16DRAFT_1466738 [Mycena metata]|uniref:Uncharacterized protein n=1 Tax=Mycena metata TaxID=1033252 RepID=A0AAD7MYF1_9AGAR|nr:hypothetical protein B0H16DRAFT_1466738 [Mycena metata]
MTQHARVFSTIINECGSAVARMRYLVKREKWRAKLNDPRGRISVRYAARVAIARTRPGVGLRLRLLSGGRVERRVGPVGLLVLLLWLFLRHKMEGNQWINREAGRGADEVYGARGGERRMIGTHVPNEVRTRIHRHRARVTGCIDARSRRMEDDVPSAKWTTQEDRARAGLVESRLGLGTLEYGVIGARKGIGSLK